MSRAWVDRYDSFAALAEAEREGVDYRIRAEARPSPALILAPHGGWIEPQTSAIAAAIASGRFSLYCFEGIVEGRPHPDLHITSRRFDEPRAVALAFASDFVVAIHGCRDHDAAPSVLLGGRDADLRDAIGAALAASGFAGRSAGHKFPGTEPANICNRGKTGAGVQLEIPRTLRDAFARDTARLENFAAAVRGAIEARLARR